MARGPLTTAPLRGKRSDKRQKKVNPALPGLDGRTRQSRRFRDLVGVFAADLQHEASQSELGLCRQAALALVLAEALQAKALRGECAPTELGEIARLQNVVTRCLLALGVGVQKRKPKPVDLKAYLAEQPKRAAP